MRSTGSAVFHVSLCSLALLFGAALVTGCDGTMCTLEARASLAVTVEDTSGAPLEGATVTAAHESDAPKACTPSRADGSSSCDFFEIAGTFTVTAEKPGYSSDERTVTVEEDECHVHTERVTLVLAARESPCCCAFIREGDFDIISEELTATEEECAARDAGHCIDPTGRSTPHPCCPDAQGDRCE